MKTIQEEFDAFMNHVGPHTELMPEHVKLAFNATFAAGFDSCLRQLIEGVKSGSDPRELCRAWVKELDTIFDRLKKVQKERGSALSRN